jgi:hypothetical protein
MSITKEIQRCLSKKLTFPESSQLQHRGIADKIELQCNIILTESFPNAVPATSRRSIEDITINDCYVDHKTSDVTLKFKMPNLISIDRLSTLNKPLIFNFVKYDSVEKKILDIIVLDVYELNWDHLSIQNLGVGQLQIKNMVSFFESPRITLSKDEWVDRLRKEAVSFYSKLIIKTENRKNKWMKK